MRNFGMMPMLIMKDTASGHKTFFSCAGWQDPRGAAEETRQGINLQFLPASRSQNIILEQQVSFLAAILCYGQSQNSDIF